ncbi:MAG: antitoxin [Acidobacteriota bacterium]
MRTTLTLDPDVAQKLQAAVAKGNSTFKAVVNDTLRRGLNAQPQQAAEKFRVEARSLGLRPGYDPHKLNQLVDELEVQDFAKPSRKGRR